MNLRPLHDRVLIERVKNEDKTSGGIIIPDIAKEKPIEGVVVAVGRGKTFDNGKLREPCVKPGDRVMFGKWAGNELKLDGRELLAVLEEDVLLVIED